MPKRSVDDGDEEIAPRPGALIESLRSFGYSPATSVADLLDNSITAEATNIDVRFVWAGPDSSVTIVDNGIGMSEDQLREAMRAGSSNPLDERKPKDLGRFGLGLKTASFSQARSLTVVTKQRPKDKPAVRRWDLDHVGRTDRWSLLKSPAPGSGDALKVLDQMDSGCVVVWNQLDRIVDGRPPTDERAKSSFFATVDQVKLHLEMVFHRMIEEDHLVIRVNSQICRAWDPFLTKHPKTEKQPSEDRTVTLANGDTEKLKIQPYVLPHRSELTADEHASAAGPKGWNLQQGFYLYRARRLIVSGDWFNPGVKPEEHHKLARIRVEITQNMDADWNLDVRKARAHPPAVLRDDFQRIARATRDKAEQVYRHRGFRSVGQAAGAKLVSVWLVESNGQSLEYRINMEHPVVNLLLASAHGEILKRIRATLQLVERNVPVGHILSQGFRDEERLPSEVSNVTEELTRTIADVFQSLCERGLTESECKTLLHNTQPFDRFPALIDALELEKQS